MNKKMGYIRFGDGCIMMAFKEKINHVIGASNQNLCTKDVSEK